MDISGILSQVKSGSGFVNPLQAPISSALAGFTIPSVAELTALASAQAAISGLPVPSAGQIIAAQSSVVNAINTVNDLIGHTNRISGVDLSGNNTLATIAKTMQSARSISGESSCASVLGAFGSIRNAANLVTDSINTIQSAKQFLLNIPGLINSIPTTLDTYVNRTVAQITSDLNALAQGQLQVLQNSIAQSLVSLSLDECTSQILSSVMSQSLKNEVSDAATKLVQNRVKSIFG